MIRKHFVDDRRILVTSHRRQRGYIHASFECKVERGGDGIDFAWATHRMATAYVAVSLDGKVRSKTYWTEQAAIQALLTHREFMAVSLGSAPTGAPAPQATRASGST